MKNRGYILTYFLIVFLVIISALHTIIFINKSIYSKYSYINNELVVKSLIESLVCHKISKINADEYISEEYKIIFQRIGIRVEKYDEDRYILYAKCIYFPNLVYYQIFQNQFTTYKSDDYIIHEEGYLMEE